MALCALAQPPLPANPIEIKPNAAVSTPVTRRQAEYDAYVEYFLDWCVEHGHMVRQTCQVLMDSYELLCLHPSQTQNAVQ